MTTETAIAKKEEKSIEYIPFGATNAIKLSAAMVSAFIAVPTKSGKLPSERDCVRFIMLCQGKRANPFEGDCFLIGYDSANGPTFSMVCGVELFLKRAEQSEDYDGYDAGVIVQRGAEFEERIVERQGAMVYEGEKILGAWCKVYRRNRSHPTYKSVKFDTFNTGRSRWEKDPAGMIVKVAVSQAHREAYPTALGGLYAQEEMQKVAESGGGAFTLEPIAMPKALPTPSQEPQAASQDGSGSTEGEGDGGEDGGKEQPPCLRGFIGEVKEKSGKTAKGKEWTAFSIKIGEAWYSTFSATIAETARQSLEMKVEVEVTYTTNAKGYHDITDLVVVTG